MLKVYTNHPQKWAQPSPQTTTFDIPKNGLNHPQKRDWFTNSNKGPTQLQCATPTAHLTPIPTNLEQPSSKKSVVHPLRQPLSQCSTREFNPPPKKRRGSTIPKIWQSLTHRKIQERAQPSPNRFKPRLTQNLLGSSVIWLDLLVNPAVTQSVT